METLRISLLFVVVASTTLIDFSRARSISLQKRAAFYIANETACVVDNIVYYNGDPIPTDDPCEACKCRPPGFACVLRECEVKPGCRAVRRAGHCCPEYICGCEHDGRMYRDGDEIRDAQNPCYKCYCQGSAIACSFTDCFFRVDCTPEYVAGECCPVYNHCPVLGGTQNKTFNQDQGKTEGITIFTTPESPREVPTQTSVPHASSSESATENPDIENEVREDIGETHEDNEATQEPTPEEELHPEDSETPKEEEKLAGNAFGPSDTTSLLYAPEEEDKKHEEPVTVEAESVKTSTEFDVVEDSSVEKQDEGTSEFDANKDDSLHYQGDTIGTTESKRDNDEADKSDEDMPSEIHDMQDQTKDIKVPNDNDHTPIFTTSAYLFKNEEHIHEIESTESTGDEKVDFTTVDSSQGEKTNPTPMPVLFHNSKPEPEDDTDNKQKETVRPSESHEADKEADDIVIPESSNKETSMEHGSDIPRAPENSAAHEQPQLFNSKDELREEDKFENDSLKIEDDSSEVSDSKLSTNIDHLDGDSSEDDSSESQRSGKQNKDESSSSEEDSSSREENSSSSEEQLDKKSEAKDQKESLKNEEETSTESEESSQSKATEMMAGNHKLEVTTIDVHVHTEKALVYNGDLQSTLVKTDVPSTVASTTTNDAQPLMKDTTEAHASKQDETTETKATTNPSKETTD